MGEQQFKHVSYQDRASIINFMREIMHGLEAGTLRFADNNGEILINPEELMQLEIKVKKKIGKARVSFKMEWKDEVDNDVKKGGFLRIDSAGQVDIGDSASQADTGQADIGDSAGQADFEANNEL